jgi:hypothetical protein
MYLRSAMHHSTTLEVCDVAARVDSLERRTRVQGLVIVLLLSSLLLGFVNKNGELMASKISILDASGKRVVTLSSGAEGGIVELLDHKGKRLVVLGAGVDPHHGGYPSRLTASSLTFYDGDHKPRASIFVDNFAHGGLWLLDENGRVRVDLGETFQGSEIEFRDSKEACRLRLLEEAGASKIEFLRGKDFKPISLP